MANFVNFACKIDRSLTLNAAGSSSVASATALAGTIPTSCNSVAS